jgi:hypothetical protein
MIGLILGGVLVYTILYSVVETNHDYWVIKNDKGYTKESENWHMWGWLQNALAFVPMAVGVIALDYRVGIPATIVSGLLFWQLHDSILGYKLHKDIFYLGKGKFDKWLDKVFWSGRIVSIIRLGMIGCMVLETIRNL